MTTCPQYRLRLFLSVDLAGSTAFKNGPGKEPLNGDNSRPRWVQRIRHFYRDFPALVRQHYTLPHPDSATGGAPPHVWKTIGDEILLCCRVVDLEHLSACVSAFLKAIEEYGTILDSDDKHLDVKGAGWIAAFPAQNVTVALDETKISVEQFDEEFELSADHKYIGVDFLGNGIDCGFRVASCATVDKFTVSVELAWLLAEAAHKKKFNWQLQYNQRRTLKGVIRDRPYPLISIDTERSSKRREVRVNERQLTGSFHSPEPILFKAFLRSFMEDEGIEFPILLGMDDITTLPDSYVKFKAAWEKTVNELTARAEAEANAEHDAGRGEENLPEDLEATIDRLLAQVSNSEDTK